MIHDMIQELMKWTISFDGQPAPTFDWWARIRRLRDNSDTRAYAYTHDGHSIYADLARLAGVAADTPCQIHDHEARLVWAGGRRFMDGEVFEPYRSLLGIKRRFGDQDSTHCDFYRFVGLLSGLVDRGNARSELGSTLCFLLDEAAGHQVVSPRSPVLPADLFPLDEWEIRPGKNGGFIHKPRAGSIVLLDGIQSPQRGWYRVVRAGARWRVARLVQPTTHTV